MRLIDLMVTLYRSVLLFGPRLQNCQSLRLCSLGVNKFSMPNCNSAHSDFELICIKCKTSTFATQSQDFCRFFCLLLCDLFSLPSLLYVSFFPMSPSLGRFTPFFSIKKTLLSFFLIPCALSFPSFLFALSVCTPLLATEMGRGGEGGVGGRWSRTFPRQPGAHIRRSKRSHGENRQGGERHRHRDRGKK